MTISPNRILSSRADMIAAIRAMQIDLGRPVCASIDDQAIGQQVVVLQKYLSTVIDWSKPSGRKFDPARVQNNITDTALPEAIITLQGIAAEPTFPPVPGYYNFNGLNLNNWNAALLAQQGNTANAIVAAMGDSTVVGAGSTGGLGGGTQSNAKSASWPTVLAGLITGGSWQSQWCENNVSLPAGGAGLIGYDTRIASAGWGATASKGPSGVILSATAPDADVFTFTPTTPIDTIEVWYMKSTGTASSRQFNVSIDADASLGTILAGAGAGEPAKATFNVALGMHAIKLTRGSGTVYEIGIVAYNSAAKEVSIYNMGAWGWTSADFIDPASTVNAQIMLGQIMPDLLLLEGGIVNDWNAGTSLATVTSNITTLVNAAKAAGSDVILMSSAPSNPATQASLAQQGAYVDNMRTLAYNLNCPYINVWELFGGTFNGARMSDDLHCNATGYSLIAGYAEIIENPAFRSA